MNEYIIKPMWFYWLQLVDNLGTALSALTIVFILTAIIGFIVINCGVKPTRLRVG